MYPACLENSLGDLDRSQELTVIGWGGTGEGN